MVLPDQLLKHNLVSQDTTYGPCLCQARERYVGALIHEFKVLYIYYMAMYAGSKVDAGDAAIHKSHIRMMWEFRPPDTSTS